MLSSQRAIQWFWTWGDPIASYTTGNSADGLVLALIGLSLILLGSLLVHPTGLRRLRRGPPGLFVHAAVATVLAVRISGWAGQALIHGAFSGDPRFYEIRWTVEVMNFPRRHPRRGDRGGGDLAHACDRGPLASRACVGRPAREVPGRRLAHLLPVCPAARPLAVRPTGRVQRLDQKGVFGRASLPASRFSRAGAARQEPRPPTLGTDSQSPADSRPLPGVGSSTSP